MERKLSDVPFEQLKIGQKLISANGKPGRIIKLEIDRFENIWFELDDGSQHSMWHHQGNKITFLG